MPKLTRCLIMLLCLCLTMVVSAQDPTPVPTAKPRPLPTETLQANGVLLERYFGELTQGNMGVLRLVGASETTIVEAQALFADRAVPFFRPSDDSAWYALVVANIDMQEREYPLQVLVALADGTLTTLDMRVTVNSGGYIRQNFTVPSDRAYLINPEVERNEYARLDALTTSITPQKLWTTGGFSAPISGEFVSPFGQYRILNSTVQTRHTGWDQKAPVGTAVTAMADGEVVFANQLDIRGNYVLINHGWGIYTGYAHLSQIVVAEGQSIVQGQLLGLSGNTGRSSGPHLHWEISVEGEWVDGQAFLGAWLP
jgi:murein DD-endopeptidase MepM/ murein hydrolase activator NlpD